MDNQAKEAFETVTEHYIPDNLTLSGNVQQIFVLDRDNNQALREEFRKALESHITEQQSNGQKIVYCDLSDWQDIIPEDYQWNDFNTSWFHPLLDALKERLFGKSDRPLAELLKEDKTGTLYVVTLNEMDELLHRHFSESHQQGTFRIWFYNGDYHSSISNVMLIPLSKRKLDAEYDHLIFGAGISIYLTGDYKNTPTMKGYLQSCSV